MTLLVNCKLWYYFSDLFPLVLAMIVVATLFSSMNPKDIREAWALGDRMKTVGEVITFVLSAAFLLICLVNAMGVVQIDGFDYGSLAKPMVDQVCN